MCLNSYYYLHKGSCDVMIIIIRITFVRHDALQFGRSLQFRFPGHIITDLSQFILRNISIVNTIWIPRLTEMSLIKKSHSQTLLLLYMFYFSLRINEPTNHSGVPKEGEFEWIFFIFHQFH